MRISRIITSCILSKLLILGNVSCAEVGILEEIIGEVENITPKMGVEINESIPGTLTKVDEAKGIRVLLATTTMDRISDVVLGEDVGARSLKLPKSLLQRKDIYSQEVELARTMRKLEKADYRIKNETALDQTIKLAYLPYRNNEGIKKPIFHDIIIKTGHIISIPVVQGYYVDEATLVEGSNGSIDIFDTNKGVILSIEEEPALVFPRPFAHTSFVPHTNICFLHLSPRVQAKIKKEFYADTNTKKAPLIDTVRVVSSTLDILVKEVEDVMDVFQKRQYLYEQNKLEKVLQELDDLPAKPRIPLNLFSIWFTSSEKPTEPSKQLLEFALASSRNNPPEEGWTHYFVTNNKNLIPNTVDFFAKSPVKVVELSELGIAQWALKTEVENAIEGKKMGLASDIARVELINMFGGAYLDIDFELFQSLKTYFYLYDSLWGEEDWSYFLCNAFMAASPNHPAILEYIRLLKRNLSENEQPTYIKKEPDRQWKTIMQTGPGAESIAVYRGVGKPGYRDIIMPIQAFFPVVRHLAGTYSPRHPCHLLESSSMHYYFGTWTAGSQYNSCG